MNLDGQLLFMVIVKKLVDIGDFMKKFTKYGISEEEERIACLVLYHIGDEYDAFDEELNDIDERLMNNSNRIDENYYLGGHCLDENYYLGLAEQDLNNNREELDNDFDNWRKRLKVEEILDLAQKLYNM